MVLIIFDYYKLYGIVRILIRIIQSSKPPNSACGFNCRRLMNVLDIISIMSSERVCPNHILHFKILAGSTFSYLYPETI